jgi:hypothetical protein
VARRSPSTLLVIRLLLIANGLLLGAVGLISFLYVQRPAGLVGAGLVWVTAAVLFGCIRFTDYYRHED